MECWSALRAVLPGTLLLFSLADYDWGRSGSGLAFTGFGSLKRCSGSSRAAAVGVSGFAAAATAACRRARSTAHGRSR